MLKLNFYPDYDKDELVEATKEYERIWIDEADKILEAIKKVSGLTFVENEINAIIFERRPQSLPLSLNAGYPFSAKKSSLIHELCHRLLDGNGLGIPRGPNQNSSLEHENLDLILYDIWGDLYGYQFADEQVVVESNRSQIYKEAWDAILSLNKEQRQIKFRALAVK